MSGIVVRGGRPLIIRATAPARPAGVPTVAEIAQAQFLDETPTIHVRIRNLSLADNLKVFRNREEFIAGVQFILLEPSGSQLNILEGPFEFLNLFLSGDGGAVAFEAALAQRLG